MARPTADGKSLRFGPAFQHVESRAMLARLFGLSLENMEEAVTIRLATNSPAVAESTKLQHSGSEVPKLDASPRGKKLTSSIHRASGKNHNSYLS